MCLAYIVQVGGSHQANACGTDSSLVVIKQSNMLVTIAVFIQQPNKRILL